MQKPLAMQISNERFLSAFTTTDQVKIPKIVTRNIKSKKSVALLWYGRVGTERLSKQVLFPVLEKFSEILYPTSFYTVASVCQIKNWVNENERIIFAHRANTRSFSTWFLRAYCSNIIKMDDDGSICAYDLISAISSFFIDGVSLVKPEPFIDTMLDSREKKDVDEYLRIFRRNISDTEH